MKAKLVVVGGDAKAAEVTLKLPTVIGRGRDATLTLPHPLVSRQHCEIFESGGQLFVRDLGSLNGTYVANERVSEAPLPPGELLTVGTVTFRAVYDAGQDLLPPSAEQSTRREAVADSSRTVRIDGPADAVPVDEVADEWDDLDPEDVAQLTDDELVDDDTPAKSNDDDDELRTFLNGLR